MSQRMVGKTAVLFFLVGFAACETDDTNTTERSVSLQLTQEVNVVDLPQLVHDFNVKPTELLFNRHGISGGYTIQPGEHIESAVDRFQELHRKFLENTIQELEATSSEKPDDGSRETLNSLRRLHEELQVGDLRVNKLQVKYTPAANRFVEAGHAWMEAIQPEARRQTPLDVPIETRSVTKSYNHETWSPYRGTVKVTLGLIYHTFKFNMNTFGSNETYEHETQIYTAGFLSYDGYWSSNMPNAYYDTPAFDWYTSPGIDVPTIGTFNADELKTYYQYYTYMSMRNSPNIPMAQIRVKGQKGEKWCDSTWCVNSKATTGSLAWFVAPIYYNLSWTW